RTAEGPAIWRADPHDLGQPARGGPARPSNQRTRGGPFMTTVQHRSRMSVSTILDTVGRERLISFVSPLSLLLLWEVLGRMGVIDGRFLPVPTAILGALVGMASTGELWAHTLASMQRLAIGVVLGGVPALLLG